jgi:hypothetical protein
MSEKITPPELIEPDTGPEPVDPPLEPHQHGEPGAPEPAPKHLPRSNDLEVPPGVRSMINSRPRIIT